MSANPGHRQPRSPIPLTGYLQAYAAVVWPLGIASMAIKSVPLTVLFYPYVVFLFAIAACPVLRWLKVVTYRTWPYAIAVATCLFSFLSLLNHIPI